MHITVLATDFDGTLSQDEWLAPEAARVLRRWRAEGRVAVLVSGRPFEFLRDLQNREQAFDLIVAENGAVLYDTRADEMRLPFGEVSDDLLDTLERLGVPLWRGIAAAGTTAPYDDAVWVASRELGTTVHVESNRNEVMLLLAGGEQRGRAADALERRRAFAAQPGRLRRRRERREPAGSRRSQGGRGERRRRS
jgi:hypothetical protein